MIVQFYRVPKYEERKISLNIMYQKGYFTFSIRLYFFEGYIQYRADDWFLSRVEEKNGRRDLIFYLNDKYKNHNEYIFSTYKFPFFFVIKGEK